VVVSYPAIAGWRAVRRLPGLRRAVPSAPLDERYSVVGAAHAGSSGGGLPRLHRTTSRSGRATVAARHHRSGGTRSAS